jgi:hypothetical protein
MDEHAAALEVGADLVACRGEAQQHGAVDGVDGVAAGDRFVPLAAVDGRGLAGLYFEAVAAQLRRRAARQGAQRGTAQQKATSFDRGRHGVGCYALPQEETR